MKTLFKYALLFLAAGLIVLCTGCRRTKICRCDGMYQGKPETLYFNVEHTFHCKDIKRSGYERLQDTLFIRSMHNVTCVDSEASE